MMIFRTIILWYFILIFHYAREMTVLHQERLFSLLHLETYHKYFFCPSSLWRLLVCTLAHKPSLPRIHIASQSTDTRQRYRTRRKRWASPFYDSLQTASWLASSACGLASKPLNGWSIVKPSSLREGRVLFRIRDSCDLATNSPQTHGPTKQACRFSAQNRLLNCRWNCRTVHRLFPWSFSVRVSQWNHCHPTELAHRCQTTQ